MSATPTQLLSAAIASIIALAVMYLPGTAILARVKGFNQLDNLSRLCIAPGVSVALYIVLLEGCYLLHLKLGWWAPWLIAILSILGILYHPKTTVKIDWKSAPLAHMTFGVVVALILFTRLIAIQGLVAPLYGDSVHHTIITQLILNNGGLFQSWQPYADSTTFTYHYGFHAIAAMYAWMRGITAEFAVLMMGQIANFCIIVGLYALVRQWTRSPWGGISAMIVGGLVSGYPYVFLFWGRYTQLTGHIILVAALVLWNHYLKQPSTFRSPASTILLGIVIGGLGMAQYKVAVLFIMMSIPLIIYHFISWYSANHSLPATIKLSLSRVIAVAGLSALVFLPRGVVIYQSALGTGVQQRVSTDIDTTAAQSSAQVDIIALSQSGLDNSSLWVWGLAILGIGIAIVWRRDSLWFPLSIVLCLLATYPKLFGISRMGLVDEFHLSLTFYIFVAALAGLCIGALADTLTRKLTSYQIPILTSLAAIAIISTLHLPPIPADSVYVLPEDVKLLAWIRDNVPPEDKIAGLSYVAFNTFTVGRDAAWWTPYYTGHQTNIMLMAAAQEMSNSTRARRDELAFTKELYERDMSLPESADWLVDQGYRYFYIGASPLTQTDEIEPFKQSRLIEQLLRNPALHKVNRMGSAELLKVD
jgi:hypothetical protein